MRPRTLAFAGLTLAALLPGALAQEACPFFTSPAGVSDHALSSKTRREVFLRVWSLTKDYFHNPAILEKTNWAAVRERFAQRAIGADTDATFYSVLNEMVRTVASEMDNFVWTKSQAEFYMGGMDALAGLGFLGERDGATVRVREVMKGAAADRAGLKAGDLITAIDGKECASFELLRGPLGSGITLGVKASDGQQRDVKAERTGLWLPPRHSTARIGPDGSVGYLLLTGLEWGEVWTTVEAALREVLAPGIPRGLILDVRGMTSYAPGNVARTLANFVNGFVGGFVDRRGVQNAIIASGGTLYEQLKDVPMVVLVDEGTIYDGEVIAAILQEQGRARVVGSQTRGKVLMSDLFTLPDGGVLGLATKDAMLRNGTRLNGRGVTPDVKVAGHWWQYPREADPVIQRAVELLLAK